MKRVALVVGINRYPFLKGSAGNSLHLEQAAVDAEAIAQLLQQYGDFEVHRFPSLEGKAEIDPKGNINAKELGEAIIQLFHPTGGIIPETALLFFAGHGLQKHDNGESEGYLAASDSCPRKQKWGLSLKWLRKLLSISKVRQQIVWLDCCHSGELFNFAQEDLAEYETGRDRSFISASREFEKALGGVLTPALLNGLNPTHTAECWVTNYTLKDAIESALKNAPQHPMLSNSGGQILLTSKQGIRGNICPYKGLAYFDNNNEDPKYFYGRTALTKELLKKVYRGNFIAVLGASGSGKSSVVRAGLLYHLQRSRAIPGSDRWKIYPPFTPGDHPLRSLEQVLGLGANQVEALIKSAAAERVVLVVDQFEEVFTLCRDEIERQQFMSCLMNAVQRLGHKLCLVVAMRADFFGKCAEKEYAGLAKRIEQNLVTVLPMNEQELREAIIRPARKVELEIDRELVNQMIADVSGSPGDLPLMQYTLMELWQQRNLNRLTISDYTRLGGVKKALEKQANLIYHSLSTEEQKIAKRIFLELTRLGEGTEDTRRQVRQQDLVTEKRSQALVERVVQKLTNAKLLVTGEEEVEGKRIAVVNIAHEALIRYWDQLGKWLKENRAALLRKQEIEDAAKEWRDKGKIKDSAYLLQGTRLASAEDYIQRFDDTVPLSNLAQELVRRSIRHRKESQRNLILSVTSVIIGLIGLAGWALIEGADAQIRADSSSSESLFASDRKLEALVSSIRATKRLKSPLGAIGAKSDTRIQALMALQQSVYGVTEINRFEGHTGEVLDISISPDGEVITSAGKDGTVKIWNNDGRLIHTWSRNTAGNEGRSIWQRIYSVSFSPDGQIIAFPSHQDVQLMDRNGKLLRILKYQGEEPPLAGLGINSVSFSPDGQIIASGGNDHKITIQTLEGKLITVLGHEQDNHVNNISFSPDNLMIASASGEGTVRLWSRDGQLLRVLNHSEVANDPTLEKRIVHSVKFSPDSKLIASAGGNGLVKVWKIDGTLLTTFSEHTGIVKSINFSPDGKMIASSGSDNIIKIWNIDGTNIANITGHTGTVNKVIFSPNGQKIITASNDGTVRIWSLQPTAVSILKGHNLSVTDVEFSSDGQIIATSSKDKTIKLWGRDGKLINTLIGHSEAVKSLSFSPDGQMIASSEEFGDHFRLWKRDGTLINSVIPSLEPKYIGEVKFSPKDKLIASASRLSLQLWSYEGKLLSDIERLDITYEGLAFSPDGQVIASYRTANTRVYDEEPSLKLWKINGKFIADLIGKKASFSPDGKLIVTAGEDGVVRIFKRDGSLNSNLTGHSKNVTDVSFSPDSQMISSASEDGTVKLWSRNGTLIKTLGHKNNVNSLSFSPDGKILATATSDGQVILWNLDLDDLLTKGCAWARNYLVNNPNLPNSDKALCNDVSSSIYVQQETSLNRNLSRQKITNSSLQELPSDVGANYTLLQSLLTKGEFKAANQETNNIIRWLAYREKYRLIWDKRYDVNDSPNKESIKNIPCADLRTINQLWMQTTNKHFGFSVQKELYSAESNNFEKLKVRLGWLRPKDQETVNQGQWIPYDEYTFNLSAVKGHLPSSDIALSGSEVDWIAWIKKLNECKL
jgi:WD40 repeat protein